MTVQRTSEAKKKGKDNLKKSTYFIWLDEDMKAEAGTCWLFRGFVPNGKF